MKTIGTPIPGDQNEASTRFPKMKFNSQFQQYFVFRVNRNFQKWPQVPLDSKIKIFEHFKSNQFTATFGFQCELISGKSKMVFKICKMTRSAATEKTFKTFTVYLGCAAGTLQTKLKPLIKISLRSRGYRHRKIKFREKKFRPSSGQKVSFKSPHF